VTAPAEHRLSRICADAVLAGMRVLRASQTGRVGLSNVRRKTRAPMMTMAHLDSQQAILSVLKKRLPGVTVLSKCADTTTTKATLMACTDAYFIVIDPAAGALPMIMGSPNFNVAIGIYSLQLRRLVAGAVGCPATGLLYLAETSSGTFVEPYDPFTWKRIDDGRSSACHTWQGDFSSQCAVFLDSAQGFTRIDYLGSDQRQVLGYTQMGRLIRELGRVSQLHMYGSNAEHQRLIATGHEYAAASFTTEVNGPWDLVGTLLVLEAGGVAVGLVLETDSDGHQYVAQVDELDALRCDIVITANKQATLDGFVAVLQRAIDDRAPSYKQA